MLAQKRRALILEELDREITVSIRDLTERLGVSRETLRKDIEFLAQTAKLQQVRGGATRIRTHEVPMAKRSLINFAGKSRIAQALAKRIPNGCSVFLDSGSSTRALAEAMASHRDLSVYTNDFDVARAVAPACTQLVMLGGQVDLEEMATFGIETIEQAGQYNVDFSVISAGGLTAQTMITDFSREGVRLRDRILKSGAKGYVIADQEKFGVVGQYALPVPKADTVVVMDVDPPGDVQSALQANGLSIMVANPA